jgi:hypothetical protein
VCWFCSLSVNCTLRNGYRISRRPIARQNNIVVVDERHDLNERHDSDWLIMYDIGIGTMSTLLVMYNISIGIIVLRVY